MRPADVGIRNLLVTNSQKSVKIVRFGNGLPRRSADWLAMTGFFDSLSPLRHIRRGLSALFPLFLFFQLFSHFFHDLQAHRRADTQQSRACQKFFLLHCDAPFASLSDVGISVQCTTRLLPCKGIFLFTAADPNRLWFLSQALPTLGPAFIVEMTVQTALFLFGLPKMKNSAPEPAHLYLLCCGSVL